MYVYKIRERSEFLKVRLRHKILISTVGKIVLYFFKKKFNIEAEKVPLKPPYLALANHTSDYEGLFIAQSLTPPFHFVMSDHVASLPIIGKLADFSVAPIPMNMSGKMELGTLRDIFSVLKQKASVCIFQEGNKSCAGENLYTEESIAKLVKKAKVPLVLFKTEGGYFSNPRWANQPVRKGKVSIKIAKILSVEEIADLSQKELYDTIVTATTVNAYELQDKNPIAYRGKKLAEGFEHIFYMCPHCNSLASLISHDNSITCTQCHSKWLYTEQCYLEGPYFHRLNDWDAWQKEQIQALDFASFDQNYCILEDLPWTIAQKSARNKYIAQGTFSTRLFNNRIEFENLKTGAIDSLSLDRIRGMALVAKNDIQITTKQGITFQLSNKTNVSGLKYINFIWAILGMKMAY